MPKNISLNDVKKFKNKFLRNNKNIASRNAVKLIDDRKQKIGIKKKKK